MILRREGTERSEDGHGVRRPDHRGDRERVQAIEAELIGVVQSGVELGAGQGSDLTTAPFGLR